MNIKGDIFLVAGTGLEPVLAYETISNRITIKCITSKINRALFPTTPSLAKIKIEKKKKTIQKKKRENT